MLNINKKLIINVFGCEFMVPEEYLNGYVFCARTGSVFVSDGEPIRVLGGWAIQNYRYIEVGRVPRFLAEEEVCKSVKPVKEYLVFTNEGTWDGACESILLHHAIEDGRLYTWGTGTAVYLRANKRVYLVEPHTSSLMDLGPSYDFQRLISYYKGFRYVSSWGEGRDE